MSKRKKGFAVGKRCKAKAKRTGKRCKNNAVTGYDVCRMHGGKTPRGWDSPHTTTGRYLNIPDRLVTSYQQSLNDPQIEDLRAEIALIDARTSELLSNLDTERYGTGWDEIKNARDSISAAMKSGDPTLMISAFTELDSAVNTAYDNSNTWEMIVKLFEQRRKLIETLRKVQLDAETTITAERMTMLIAAVGRIIQAHVTDRKKIGAISTDIGILFAGNPEKSIR